MAMTSQEYYDSIKTLAENSAREQSNLNRDINKISSNTERLTKLFEDFTKGGSVKTSPKFNDDRNNPVNPAYNKARLAEIDRNEKFTKTQVNYLVTTLNKGFSNMLTPLDELSGGLVKPVTDGLSAFNTSFSKWTSSFNTLFNDSFLKDFSKGTNYQGTITKLFGDLTSGKVGYDTGTKTLINMSELHGSVPSTVKSGLSALPSIAGGILKIAGPVAIIAGVMAGLTAILTSLVKGVDLINDRNKELTDPNSIWFTKYGISLKGYQDIEDWMKNSPQAPFFRTMYARDKIGYDVDYSGNTIYGAGDIVKQRYNNDLYADLYGGRTFSYEYNGELRSGSLKGRNEQIESFYEQLSNARENMTLSSGNFRELGALTYHWSDYLHDTTLATQELFQTVTRFYDDDKKILNDLYGKAFSLSESLNVSASSITNIANTYSAYLKNTSKSNQKFNENMQDIMHTFAILEDFGLNGNEWFTKLNDFGKGTISSAANDPTWTALAMVGVNPVEAFDIINNGGLGAMTQDATTKFQNFFKGFAGTDLASTNTRRTLAAMMGISGEASDRLSMGENIDWSKASSKGESVEQLQIQANKELNNIYTWLTSDGATSLNSMIKTLNPKDGLMNYFDTLFFNKLALERWKDGFTSFFDLTRRNVLRDLLFGINDAKDGAEFKTSDDQTVQRVGGDTEKGIAASKSTGKQSSVGTGWNYEIRDSKGNVTYKYNNVSGSSNATRVDNTADIAGQAGGLNFVPMDTGWYKLHYGERVLTKSENEQYTQEIVTARMALKPIINNTIENPLYVSFDQSRIDRIIQILETQYEMGPTQIENVEREVANNNAITSNDIYQYI